MRIYVWEGKLIGTGVLGFSCKGICERVGSMQGF